MLTSTGFKKQDKPFDELKATEKASQIEQLLKERPAGSRRVRGQRPAGPPGGSEGSGRSYARRRTA